MTRLPASALQRRASAERWRLIEFKAGFSLNGFTADLLFRLFDAHMQGAGTCLEIMQQQRLRGMLERADCESPHRMPHILLPFSFGPLKYADSCDVDAAGNSFENANHSQLQNGWTSKCRDSG
jgi:hypothetical protein